MDLLGRAKKWVRSIAPAEPPAPQPFRVVCPEGHIIRGRRTEGYQALRCPECGEGVFVLPRSPLPMPPTPAPRDDRHPAAGSAVEDAPIPLADHVPDPMQEAEDIEWLEPVGPPGSADSGDSPGFDPVEAAVSELPTYSDRPAPPPPRRPVAPRSGSGLGPAGRPPARTRPAASGPGGGRGAAAEYGPRILVPARPTLGERFRRNRPMLVGMAVVGILAGTIAWTLLQNQRRNAPALVRQGRDEGIPALEAGDFDRAHRILSRAAAAVEALGGQIGGAEEIRQAAREAAIFNDLIPDRLESILDRRARSSDEAEWQRFFNTNYRGQSILISAHVVSTPEDAAGRYELNYRILTPGPLAPRQARIDFEGFRLFEIAAPRAGTQVQFGARLAAVESEADGWRFRLLPDSGVTMTHQAAFRALGWGPVETASTPDAIRRPWPFTPALMTSLLGPPLWQGLEGETPDEVLRQLGAPRSFARSASQGTYVEQWIYDGPSGTRQYLNFVRSTDRSGLPVVDREFFLR